MIDVGAPETSSAEPSKPVVEQGLSLLLSVFWNGGERRLRAFWRLMLLAVVAGVIFRTIQATGLLPERGTLSFYVVSAALRLPVFLGAVWLAGRLIDRRRFRDFGFSLDRAWWEDLGFGLFLGAALMTAIFVVEWAAGWVHVTGTFRAAAVGEPFGRSILAPLFIFFVVGVVEELVTRGYLLRNIAEGLAFQRLGGGNGGIVLACGISSVLFALGHLDNPNATWVSTANIAVAGVLLALGFVLTGELAIPIGLHISWNLFQASVFGFPVSGVTFLEASFVATEQSGPALWTGGAFGPEAGLVGLGAMVVGLVVIAAWLRWRRGEVRLAARLGKAPARVS